MIFTPAMNAADRNLASPNTLEQLTSAFFSTGSGRGYILVTDSLNS